MTSLALRNLAVRYDDAPAIEEVTVEVASGEWLGVIGPNGAGKSTMIKAIVGLVKVSGEVHFDGATLTATQRARTVAYLPQHPMLPAGMTVAEYVLLGRTAHLKWLAGESHADRAASADAIERLGLASFAGRDVTELSGGEAQRVTLARSLALEAPVLLLDEPTSALDIGHQVAVLELVDELRIERGLTVVAAMHDLTSAGRFADRLLLLADGGVAANGPVEEVLQSDVLAAAYGAPVTILVAPDGSRVILPDRSSTPISKTPQNPSPRPTSP